jgi:lipid II:glycine glycyltransferase (peptidoglycan interpeptide bridge formation enzyme)
MQDLTTPKLDCCWAEISVHELTGWNRDLLQTNASFFQFPYWNEPLRRMHFVPRYLTYRSNGSALAYVAVLTIGIPGMRIGLVQRGPVSLVPNQEVPITAFGALKQWAKRGGYIFLRFTHPDANFSNRLSIVAPFVNCDPFPFYRDFRDELIVEQVEDDAEMLGSFQSTARRKIRKAAEAGFEITSSDSSEKFCETWPLFLKLAKRKGFRHRPLASYLDLIKLASPHGCVRIYVAAMKQKPVESIVIVADRTTASYMSGALDTDALEGKPSPSCLLHWQAMRDFFRLGVKYYHLGTRSGEVYQFKRQFRPIERDNPPPLTLITNPLMFRVWAMTILRLGPIVWPCVKRLAFQ